MKRPLLFALFFTIGSLFVLGSQKTEEELPIDEAFKENWVPPGPVYTPRNNRPKQISLPKALSFNQKISENASLEELEFSRVLSRPLPLEPAQNMSKAHCQGLAVLLGDIRNQGGAFNVESAKAIESYLTEQPDSPVCMTLLIEQGDIYYCNCINRNRRCA